MNHELIITIVNRGFSQLVMDAARAAGATGGTILHARGSGVHEEETFYGISVQPEKEIVFIVVTEDDKRRVMQAVCEGAGLNTQGRGLCFSVPVDDVLGVTAWSDNRKE